MEKRLLGKTGIKLSLVGIGGIPFIAMDKKCVERVILRGIDCGVNFVETARGYGDSEEKIGAALVGRRKDVFIITKGHLRNDLDQLEKSLAALDVDCLDVYQLHGVGPGRLKIMEEKGLLDKLMKARADGKFVHLGITTHHPEAVHEALEYGIFTSVQAPINFVEYDRYRECMEKASANGLGILAMKPLGGGVFPARESLRFLKFTPVSAVPVGVKSPEEIEEDVLAVSGGEPLSAEERKLLDDEIEYWGDKFCRKCGYCRGCPEGIPTGDLMLTDIMLRRNGPEFLIRAGHIEKLNISAKCTGCGECVKKCPYDLNIPETIRSFREKCLPLLEGMAGGEPPV